ncbi:hypothetical protein GA0070624_0574 [Micromonospora rhizosphaerae]|uniref:DUF3592 domain-containing protein n=1 Tax=Micromonospora rhizosphaerae TaxID=568872 RepID=A0A1C6RCT2_9ACTN|nr:hypothetical protein [Micromonospora rhizosphaerae]SCL14960.1 hypothetical protein GA0070624_0574 [Micromonospora rhizosphaerae]
MSGSLRCRGRARRHRLSLIACFTAAGAVAALADLFAWEESLPIVAFVIAVVVAGALVLDQRVWSAASLRVKAAAMAAFVASFFWLIAMMYAPRLTVLALRGEPVVASVVDHDVTHYSSRSGGYDVHCYSLQRTDGSPIFGDICRHSDDEIIEGETISVLVDPSGLIAPETPDEVADARFWQIPGLVSLVATLVLCWVTGGLIARVGSGHLVPDGSLVHHDPDVGAGMNLDQFSATQRSRLRSVGVGSCR